MGLINLFGNPNLNNVNSVPQNGSENMSAGNVTAKLAQALQQELNALKPGQVLSGQVMERSGDQVKLLVNLMGNDVEMDAKLSQNLALAVGKNIVFQVKNNGNSLTLNPLFENMGMEENGKKALDAAGIPENDKSLLLVSTMMKEGMSIDKNSLSQMYHQAINHPDSSVMDIIDLNRLGLPVTDDNLEQIASYKNLTHQITDAVADMAAELPGALNEMLDKGNIGEALEFIKGLPMEEEGEVPPEDQALQEGKEGDLKGEVTKTVIKEVIKEEENKTQAEVKDPSDLKNTSIDSKNALEQLIKDLKNGETDPKEGAERLKELLSKEDGKNAIKEAFVKELSIRPEMTDKDGVKKLYQSLNRELQNLSNVLKGADMAESNLGKLVQNTTQNLDFLEQVNQMYSYMQLPFKLSGQDANGELYVYTNKKNLSSKEGEVSAFLHLDMEHLGPVNCMVRMQDQKVSTKFTVQDDEMLDFLNEHMDILTKRLEDRGYNMKVHTTVFDKEQEDEENKNSVFRELIQRQSNRPLVSNLSFDVRT